MGQRCRARPWRSYMVQNRIDLLVALELAEGIPLFD
jgi:hypothetical protein